MQDKQVIDFYNTLHVTSRGALWNFINGGRNLGKTTGFACRSKNRFCRRQTTTLWLRRFKDEAKQSRGKLFKPTTMKLCGLTKNNFRWNGYEAQILIKDKWHTFLRLAWLSQWAALRSADDGTTDTVIFDEYRTTPERYSRYRGNEVENLIDLVSSMKREHDIRVFFLGNKEYPINPYYSYFGISVPDDFVGLKTFKNGSILIENNDDIPDAVNESYRGKWRDSLADTPYGKYLFENEYKRGCGDLVALPKNSKLVYQFDFENPVSVYAENGIFYAKTTHDKTRLIFTDKPRKYARQRVIRPADKFYFTGLITAYKFNLIRYCDNSAYINLQPVLKTLNLI